MQAALASLGVADFEFEYVKQKGSQLTTRSTTLLFYTLDISGDEAMVQLDEPSLQQRMIEVHMGMVRPPTRPISRFSRQGCSLLFWRAFGWECHLPGSASLPR